MDHSGIGALRGQRHQLTARGEITVLWIRIGEPIASFTGQRSWIALTTKASSKAVHRPHRPPGRSSLQTRELVPVLGLFQGIKQLYKL